MTIYDIELYTPHAAQQQFHACTARFVCLACGRRFGKTVAAANEACRFACENPSTLTWWVAPTYRQARIAYRQIKQALRRVSQRSSETELRLELLNHAVIECRSADNPDNLRGEGVHFLVMEEAAMMPAKVWFEILRPMLSDTNGRAVFISTPKGRNWFYTLFQRGLDPLEPEYASFHFPTSANPFIPPEEIEAARRDLPEAAFRQEYRAEFLEEQAGVFRNIPACISGPWTGEGTAPVAGHLYVLGWDPAKYQDFSVMTVMDATTMTVVDWYRTNQVDYAIQLQALDRLARRYEAMILMDRSGVGDPLFEAVQRRGYTVEGFVFTQASKKVLIEALQLGIEQGRLRFPAIPILLKELGQFEYRLSPGRIITYSAPEGEHDDAVISLALAYYAAARPRVPLSGEWPVGQASNSLETAVEIVGTSPTSAGQSQPTMATWLASLDPFQFWEE
jgi:hypothetical protein